MPIAMVLGAFSAAFRISSADTPSQSPKPNPCPCELDPKNCQANWNHDYRRPWRNDHDDPEYENRNADNCHDDSTSQPHCKVESVHHVISTN
jgi:hypothetical protein